MLIFKVLCGSIRILSIKIVLWASPLPINNKDKTVDIKQDLGNQEEIDKLRLETKDLKKDLERERLLHSMLYKEWKELQEQASARENVVVENGKAGNGFYKYAFYILLIIMVPIGYFLYPPAGFEKTHVTTQSVPDSTLRRNSSSTLVTSTLKDTVAKIDTASPTERKENNEIPIHKTAISPPVIKPAEKKLTPADSTKKPAKVIVRKPVIEGPITEDIRDSIASEGFSAYFYHNRNPYRRASGRYKIWIKGWNSGKEEGKKVVSKDPSLKNK
jgi:hypothetical protein